MEKWNAKETYSDFRAPPFSDIAKKASRNFVLMLSLKIALHAPIYPMEALGILRSSFAMSFHPESPKPQKLPKPEVEG